jgi:hypothetical protein
MLSMRDVFVAITIWSIVLALLKFDIAAGCFMSLPGAFAAWQFTRKAKHGSTRLGRIVAAVGGGLISAVITMSLWTVWSTQSDNTNVRILDSPPWWVFSLSLVAVLGSFEGLLFGLAAEACVLRSVSDHSIAKG